MVLSLTIALSGCSFAKQNSLVQERKTPEGRWQSDVYFSSGDTEGTEPVTLVFDPGKQTVSLELKVMWQKPIIFTPMADITQKSCSQIAEDVVTASQYFQKHAKQSERTQLLDETKINDGKIHDVRAFVETPDGETLTLDRFRINFENKIIMLYNPIEDTYAALQETSNLFETMCK